VQLGISPDRMRTISYGKENVDAFVAERATELLFQNVFHAAHHEVHNGLRGVDDAVSIGFLGRVALKETLINRVKEFLFLLVGLRILRRQLDGFVEAIQIFQERIAAEFSSRHRVDDLFDFDGDDIAAGEVGIIEDPAEDTLG